MVATHGFSVCMDSFNMKKLSSLFSLAAAGIGFAALTASGQFLAESFDSDISDDWHINIDGQAEVIFGFDYSQFGIPAAPNGTGTKGLYMRANWDLGQASGVSVSPKNFSLPSGDFVMKFDVLDRKSTR